MDIIEDRLEEEKNYLENRLKGVDLALKLLDQYPEIETVLNILVEIGLYRRLL